MWDKHRSMTLFCKTSCRLIILIAPTTSTLQKKTCVEDSDLDAAPSTDCSTLLKHDKYHTGKSTSQHDPDNIVFPYKGIRICNLNIKHVLPKIDEIKILLSHKNALI